MIGWNSGHTAVTLPDGTPVSSGEGGGVRVGGGGAYQKQFTHHMYLPMPAEQMQVDPAAPQDDPAIVDVANPEPAAPELDSPIDTLSAPELVPPPAAPDAPAPGAPPVAEMPV